ncbi:hypothetical protein V8E53_004335 [Lactarius tabidus]
MMRRNSSYRSTSIFLLTSWTLSVWLLVVPSHLATCMSASHPKGRTCPSRSLNLCITTARRRSLVLPLVILAEATGKLV